jgi:hypothetical protein
MAIESFKFNEQEKADLESIEQDIQVIERDLDKAKEVGIDVSKQAEQIAGLRKLRDGLLKKFCN